MDSSCLASKIDPYIVRVVSSLQKAGYEAYVVGGALRDLLLGREPKDYDITTAATPEQVRAVFRKEHTLIVGRRFRLVHLMRGRDITEISTFRKRPAQSSQTNRPKRCADAPDNMIFRDNEFGTAEDDAFRRDFTVNSLFYDPVSDTIRDFTGLGMEDIRNGVVRTIGDPALRFEEDPVRILRALKLIGQYGFRFEPETEAALRASLKLIWHASPARLALELEKILRNSYTAEILSAFRKYEFLQYFLPELDRAWDSPAMQYALELLALRGERIRAGLFRRSLSSAAAMIALPFAEQELGSGEKGCLWEIVPGIEPVLKHTILRAFSPLVLTHRTVANVIANLMLQPRLKEGERLQELPGRNGYSAARELAVIQNLIVWRIPDFEETRPPSCRAIVVGKRRRRRSRRRRQKLKDGIEAAQQTSEAATPDQIADATAAEAKLAQAADVASGAPPEETIATAGGEAS